MSDLGLRELFKRELDAVEAPPAPLDAVRVRGRRRQLRRRALVGVSSAAVVACAATGIVLDRSRASHDPAPTATVDIDPARPLPYLQHDRLAVALPDGTTRTSSQPTETVFGLTAHGIVLENTGSRLLLLPLNNDGKTGAPAALAPGPVRDAALSPDSSTYVYIGLDDVLHLRSTDEAMTDPDLATSTVDRNSTVLATAGDAWVLLDYKSRRITIHRIEKGVERAVAIPGSFVTYKVELAGNVLVMQSTRGPVQTFDAATGRLTNGHVADDLGAISPDGTMYVSGNERPGTAPVLENLRSGARTRLTGLASDELITRVAWQGTTRFFLAGYGSDRGTLWSCTVRPTCTRLAALRSTNFDLPYQ